MAFQTYMKFPQKIDVHHLTEATSAAGQVTKTYYYSETINGFMMPGSHERDVSPYVKDVDQYHIHIPKQYNDVLTYKSRLYNIRDNRDNVVENGPLEIVSIMKWTGPSGKIHHLHITARVVVEVQ